MPAEQAEYRAMDALACAAGYVDAEGDILVANEPLQALLPPRVASGSTRFARQLLPSLFVQEDRDAIHRILAAAARQARHVSQATTLEGSRAPVLADFVPIQRRSRPAIVWLVTLRVSSQATNRRVDRTNAATLSAGIVHDLRAPLQVVLGWATLLKRKLDDPARIEQALRIIERNAESMMDLLEDLRELSLPSWTRRPVQRQEVDLTDLVQSESRAMQPLADRAGVRMSLVAEASAIAVNGNERHMRRVIANLIGNALKFTPSGGSIECRVRALTPWAAIEVRDNGRGIARDFLPRVFEPFRQERSERRERRNGVGLGLHIVRDLVESHGGTVTAESAGVGCGATFTVLLPMKHDQVVRREHGNIDRHLLNVEVKRSDHGMR